MRRQPSWTDSVVASLTEKQQGQAGGPAERISIHFEGVPSKLCLGGAFVGAGSDVNDVMPCRVPKFAGFTNVGFSLKLQVSTSDPFFLI
jgi:hypothetical protein